MNLSDCYIVNTAGCYHAMQSCHTLICRLRFCVRTNVCVYVCTCVPRHDEPISVIHEIAHQISELSLLRRVVVEVFVRLRKVTNLLFRLLSEHRLDNLFRALVILLSPSVND